MVLTIGFMTSTAAILEKRRAAADKARHTKRRNDALRTSKLGRLLLLLEGCVSLINSGREISSRRFARLMKDLRHACKLAQEAGVRHGWLIDNDGVCSLVFELDSGDVVFSTRDESLGDNAFPRQPVATDSSRVVAEAIRVRQFDMVMPCAFSQISIAQSSDRVVDGSSKI